MIKWSEEATSAVGHVWAVECARRETAPLEKKYAQLSRKFSEQVDLGNWENTERISIQQGELQEKIAAINKKWLAKREGRC